MSKVLSNKEATQSSEPIQTCGSKGIRKSKRADPLNAAEPLVCPQESATMKKNHSQAMKDCWAKCKVHAQKAKEDAGNSDEQIVTTQLEHLATATGSTQMNVSSLTHLNQL